MATIPLSEIPNAPQLGAPVLSDAPRARTDTAGISQTLLTPALRQGSFDGPSRGLGAVAEGLQQAGAAPAKALAIMGDYHQKMTRANDVTSLAQRDSVRAQWMADFTASQMGKPESEWVANFDRELPKLQKLQEQYPVSELSAIDANADQLGWVTQQRAKLTVSSADSAFRRGTEAVMSAIQRNTESGNVGEAMKFLNYGITTGHIPESARPAFESQINEKVRQGELDAAIVNNPRAVQADMEEALKSGKAPSAFSWMADKSQMRNIRDRARSEGNALEVDARQEANDDVMLGLTPKQIREKYTGRLGEAALTSLEKSAAKEIDYNPETISKIRTRIAGADFKNDLEMKAFNEISRELETKVPERLRGPLSSELYQTWSATVKEGKSKTPEQEFTSSLMREVDKFAEQGLLMPGGTGYGTKKGEISKLVNPEQHTKVWEKAEMIKGQMRDWLKANPNADPAAARKRFMDLIGADAADAAAQAFENARNATPWWKQLGKSTGEIAVEMINGPKPNKLDALSASVDAELDLPNGDADPDKLIP